jgi:glucose/arabinose dehydrogenase
MAQSYRTWILAAAMITPLSLPSCITTQRVANNLSSPVFATHAPFDNGRLFIVERGGRIKILTLGSGVISTFLDLSTVVKSGGEQGLLGLAFHPNYASNRAFYVNYTGSDGATNVVEYLVNATNPNVADSTTARLILKVAQPQANHNGGWLGFGPDNVLYVAMGDGGNSNDDGPGHTIAVGNGQDIEDNLLGKMLRINPNPAVDDFPTDPNKNYTIPVGNPFIGIPGDDEIWSYGLRNPWRCSFDRLLGDLWIADVGQDTREEINFEAEAAPGGANYGWRLREGSIENPAAGVGGPKPPGNVDPLYDYAHGFGQFQGLSVTGGYVYRGPVTELQGKYFFADYITQKVWSLTKSGNSFVDLTDWSSQFRPDQGAINGISSFGEDNLGNLYIVDLDGEIFKVVSMSPFGKALQSARTTVQRFTSR